MEINRWGRGCYRMERRVPACRPVPNIDYGEGDLGTSCRLAPSSLSSTLNSFTTAHPSSRTPSQRGFQCSAALFLRCLFLKKTILAISLQKITPLSCSFAAAARTKSFTSGKRDLMLIFQGKIRVIQSLTVSSCDLQACVSEQTVL